MTDQLNINPTSVQSNVYSTQSSLKVKTQKAFSMIKKGMKAFNKVVKDTCKRSIKGMSYGALAGTGILGVASIASVFAFGVTALNPLIGLPLLIGGCTVIGGSALIGSGLGAAQPLTSRLISALDTHNKEKLGILQEELKNCHSKIDSLKKEQEEIKSNEEYASYY